MSVVNQFGDIGRIFLSLGSNMGDRLGMLRAAIAEIDRHPNISVNLVSGVAGVYETSPVGCEGGQPMFLNTAVEVVTELSAFDLLGDLLSIETKLGRTRSSPNEPRMIDIDLLLYGTETSENTTLRLPHPRMHERRFVLEPLCEIAENVVHPVLGKTIFSLAEQARAEYSEDVIMRVGGPGELFTEL